MTRSMRHKVCNILICQDIHSFFPETLANVQKLMGVAQLSDVRPNVGRWFLREGEEQCPIDMIMKTNFWTDREGKWKYLHEQLARPAMRADTAIKEGGSIAQVAIRNSDTKANWFLFKLIFSIIIL